MTETIDAAPDALDHPVRLDLPSTALLPPPSPDQPMSTELPPPPVGLQPTTSPAPVLNGPSAIFSADTAIVPPEYSAPVLPTITAPTPTEPPKAAAGTAFDVEEFLSTPGPGRKAPTKKRRRWLVRLLVLGLLGGGGWMAQQHGPDLYDEHFGDAVVAPTAEATAPLAFPIVTADPLPIRTAEFILVGLPETPGVTYHVTTDFETDVSQVDITRTGAPDLQILTYADDAMIRRSDSEQWYLLDRGQFPLDGRLDRSDWVRRIDELLPSAVRDQAVIDASTESTISGVPTRHLSLTILPGLLDSLAVDEALPQADADIDPATSIAEPLDLAVTNVAEVDAVEAAPAPAPGAAIAIEIWIDGNGLVRQISGAPQLGADTITVVRTSAEAWIPQYPSPDEISDLTASALVDLGI